VLRPSLSSLLPLRQDEPHGLQGGGHPRPLGGGARGRHQHPHLPRQQQLQRLHALARDLEMRLFGAQRLALRIQSRRGPRQGPQIREPPLRISRRGCDHDKDPLCKPSRQRGQQHGGTRAGEAGDTLTRAGRGQTLRERACRGEGIQPVDDEVERHQRVRVATPSSTTAHSSASTSSSPEPSRRPAPANRAAANAAPSSTSALSTSCTSSGDAGVRSDSRGSSPYTVAPTVSAPRMRNSTRGAPSTSEMGASPRAKRFTSASTNGTKAGDAGSAVHAVSSRLPRSRWLPSRTSHGSPFTVASTVLSSPIRRPASPVMGSIRYLRVTCRPASAGTAGPAIGPGVPAAANRHRPPRAASARFAWPIRAGSAGGTTTLTGVPASGRSPIATSVPPLWTRCPSSSTASAAATNGPPPGLAATRAGGATRHTIHRRSSARSSSASSTTSPTHQPGPSDGSVIATVDPGAASARPTSRPWIRSVTDAAPFSVPAAGVPTMPIAAAPSVTRAAPTPRFANAWLGGARAGTRRWLAWERAAAPRPARRTRSTRSAATTAAGVAVSSAAHFGAPPRSDSGGGETRPLAAPGARAGGATRGSLRQRARRAPPGAGTSREQPKRHAERHVGQDVLVSDAVPPTRRAPRVDLPTYRRPVRPRQLARPDHDARRGFRIAVPDLGRAGQLGLRRIH